MPDDVPDDDALDDIDDLDPGGGEIDAELYDRLATQNFSGGEQELFEARLAIYALPVIAGWIGSGEIYARCAQLNRPVWARDAERAELDRDPQERAGLANSTVAYALRLFRKHALHGGRWRPDGGRCLASYFIGTCLLRFPSEFRRWSRERRRQPPTTSYGVDAAAGLDGARTDRPSDDPAEVVVAEITSTREMDTMPPRIRAIVQGVLAGWTHAQIGEGLGISARAVEAALYRYRRSLRDDGVA